MAQIRFTGADFDEILGDDAAGRTIRFNQADAACLVQEEPLAGGTAPFLKAKGNVAGNFAFTVTTSLESLDEMLTVMLATLQMVGKQGALKLTRDAANINMANAVLQSVQRSPESEGVKLALAFIFRHTGFTQGV